MPDPTAVLLCYLCYKADARRGMVTQDVSKKGLKYGDEGDDEAEKKEFAAQKVAFAPLLDWLKKDLGGLISDGERIE
jgi:heat shock protein beta